MADPTRRQIAMMADEVGITDYSAAVELVRRAFEVSRSASAALAADGPAVPEGHQPAPPAAGEPSAEDLLPAEPPDIPTTMAMQYRSAWREGVEDGWNEARAFLATRAAELLKQRHPEPVPVSERPWEREGWCDGQDRCWFGTPEFCFDDAIWTLHPPAERLSKQTVCLPAHALPLPAREVK